MITFVYNPIDVMVKAVENLYPDINVSIQFNPELKSPGATSFSKQNGKDVALIDINAEIPFDAAIEALAGELAHAATKTLDKKDPKWNKALQSILAEFSKLVDEHIANYKKTNVK